MRYIVICKNISDNSNTVVAETDSRHSAFAIAKLHWERMCDQGKSQVSITDSSNPDANASDHFIGGTILYYSHEAWWAFAEQNGSFEDYAFVSEPVLHEELDPYDGCMAKWFEVLAIKKGDGCNSMGQMTYCLHYDLDHWYDDGESVPDFYTDCYDEPLDIFDGPTYLDTWQYKI